ncbi:MAG TPA: aconitate hydratase B, partial [Magnetococcales bacterium]|nr:aconitate hydratase B [Magnetococcales bacterium]
MLEAYRQHVTEREKQGIPPLPLSVEQTLALTQMLLSPPSGEGAFLKNLLANQVPPGVDDASRVKAEFLAKIAKGEAICPLMDRKEAVVLLGTMIGGFNVIPLIDLLDDSSMAGDAVAALSNTLMIYDSFARVVQLAQSNVFARQVLQNWADGTWFTSRPPMPQEVVVTVFKVDGEINTDDFSPASEAWSRPDIPLHAQSMLGTRSPGALDILRGLRAKSDPIVFVGDVVGTGSSRKSAVNSLLWFVGHDIPHVPAKRTGGVIMGGTIAPIFFNTAEDSGMLPIQCDVSGLSTGDRIVIHTTKGVITRDGVEVTRFALQPNTLADG